MSNSEGIVLDMVRIALWMGRYHFDMLHEKFRNRAEAEDILADMTRAFYIDFIWIYDDKKPWEDAFSTYNATGFDDLIFIWSKKYLWKNHKIAID